MPNLVCSARVLTQDPGSIRQTQLLTSQEENGDMAKSERLELESLMRTSYVPSPGLQTLREAIKPACKLFIIQIDP